MPKAHLAACLLATALTAAPAIAQTPPAPTATPPAGAVAPSNVNAAEFVNQAANSGMFEIQSSEMALDKSRDDRIREFAQHMVRDHTQASEKLKAAAGSIPGPTALDPEHAKMLQQLQQAAGNDFTRTFVQMQFEGHQKAVSLFVGYAQNGDNPQLKQFAQETAPTLRNHLQQVTQIRQSMLGTDRMAHGGSPRASSSSYMTQPRPDLWRASKLTGLNVYNENDEKIGDINEVLMDRNGKAEAVVIGVGGFLGLGEHDVAVPFSALRWEMTARSATASGNAPAPGTPRTDTTLAPSPTPGAGVSTTGSTMATAGSDTRGYPERAILPNASKDQLKNAPQFRYGSNP
jgi:putative membrane protein